MFSHLAATHLKAYCESWKFPNDMVARVCAQFKLFRNGVEPYGAAASGDCGNFWKLVAANGEDSKVLSNIAIRILSIIPHSMATERAFSIMGWLNSPRRSKMSTETLMNSTKLYAHFRELTSNTRINRGSDLRENIIQTDLKFEDNFDRITTQIDEVNDNDVHKIDEEHGIEIGEEDEEWNENESDEFGDLMMAVEEVTNGFNRCSWSSCLKVMGSRLIYGQKHNQQVQFYKKLAKWI